MLDRHLRSDEIDLLLDGEEGFGVSPLRAHARSCVQCRMDVERAREVLVLLDALPDFGPSALFAARVMSQVQVFEPWHAAALNSVSRFVPKTRPARVAAGVGAAASVGLLTAAGAWALSRADIGFLLAQVGLERIQDKAGAAVTDVISAALGQSTLSMLHAGGSGFAALALGGFVAAAGIAVVGLRAVATASRRSRQ
ncbi:MAG: hypothetical protein M3Y64_06310 [Gemmatimonadota bacterium]|nr:hypothetical protein [Gemmatimonadota bacterium]